MKFIGKCEYGRRPDTTIQSDIHEHIGNKQLITVSKAKKIRLIAGRNPDDTSLENLFTLELLRRIIEEYMKIYQ